MHWRCAWAQCAGAQEDDEGLWHAPSYVAPGVLQMADSLVSYDDGLKFLVNFRRPAHALQDSLGPLWLPQLY